MSEKIRDSEYLFLTARVRALENHLLGQSGLEQLLEAPDAAAAAQVLTDRGYPELEQINEKSLTHMLTRARSQVMEELAQLVPDPSLLQVFQVEYDYHNAKAILKGEATGSQVSRLLTDSGRLPPQLLEDTIKSGDFRNLPPLLAEGITEARQILSATQDPQLGDLALDSFCFAEMLALGEKSPFLLGYVRQILDAANLRSVVRVLRMGRGGDFLERLLLPGGSIEISRILSCVNTGGLIEELYSTTPLAQAAQAGTAAIRGESLTQFEKLCDDATTHYIQTAKFVSFGDAPVVAYLSAKLAELKAIRIVMSGKLAGLDTAMIRERMREPYV